MSDDAFGARDEREDLFKLEERVLELIDQSNEGEYDGNEIGAGVFTMYIYGPSAERLWILVEPLLTSCPISVGSSAIKRFGPPGAKEERVLLA